MMYESDYFQQFVRFVLIANFAINILDSEMSSNGSIDDERQKIAFQVIDLFFTCSYIIKLLLSHYWSGNHFC